MYFQDIRMIVPGGFSCEINGEIVTAGTFDELDPKVRELMARHGVKGSVEEIVADYMYPRTENRYLFFTDRRPAEVLPSDAYGMALGLKYGVTDSVAGGRISKCVECPCHVRSFCTTCTGYGKMLMDLVGRDIRSELSTTGMCTAIGSFVAAIANSDGLPEELMARVPDGCCMKGEKK